MQTAISQAKQPPPQLKIYCGMREGKEGIAVVDTELVVREVLGLTPLIQRNVLRPMERCGSRMGPNQLVILRLLREHGPLTMAQLGRALSVCRQQMTLHIEELIRKGLVTRAQGEKDRRTVVVALTPPPVDSPGSTPPPPPTPAAPPAPRNQTAGAAGFAHASPAVWDRNGGD